MCNFALQYFNTCITDFNKLFVKIGYTVIAHCLGDPLFLTVSVLAAKLIERNHTSLSFFPSSGVSLI